mmetsp:Transcript_4094/g.10401  ORF Transcript_4094/g.10401 Transcript_4094/m.10401 type:complete len:224 (+) Transcript_4094:44-715(+)
MHLMLNFYVLQLPQNIIIVLNLLHEKSLKPSRLLGLIHVHNIVSNIVMNIQRGAKLILIGIYPLHVALGGTLSRTCDAPFELTHLVLEAREPRLELLHLHIIEGCQLFDLDRRVQGHVRTHLACRRVRRHFIHEVLHLELVGVLSVGDSGTARLERLGVVRHSGVYKFGTGENEEVFIALFTRFNFGEGVAMFVANNVGNGIVDHSDGANVGKNGKEGDHTVE